MKNFKKITALVLIIAADVAVFTSCGGNAKKIIGIWESEDERYWEFTEDGKFLSYSDNDEKNMYINLSGWAQYVVEGDKLYLIIEDEDAFDEFTIQSISKELLVLTTEDEDLEEKTILKKVD